jgi:hypothetical protein
MSVKQSVTANMQTVPQRAKGKGDDEKPPVTMVTFRCPRDLKRQLNVCAAQTEKTVQDICVDAIRKYLAEAA